MITRHTKIYRYGMLHIKKTHYANLKVANIGSFSYNDIFLRKIALQ